MTTEDRDTRALYALHDGEASAWQRFLLRRRLARDPAAKRELGTVSEIGALMRENAAEAASPDLWEGIQARLPYAEAPVAESAPARRGGPLLPKAVGAALATAAAVLALVFFSGTSPVVDGVRPGAVEWLDAGGSGAMVLQDDAEATIIWMLSDDDGRTGHESV